VLCLAVDTFIRLDFLVAAMVTFRAAALVRAEPVKGTAYARPAGISGRNGVS